MSIEHVTDKTGHRQRVREQIEKNGICSLPPHQMLEFLLFYGIPQKDTKAIAYQLISKFGNFQNVLDASVDALCEVPNMTRNAAVLLHTIPQVCRFYGEKKLSARTIDNAKDVVSYVRSVTPTGEEGLCLFCLDDSNHILAIDFVALGNRNQLMTSTKNLLNIAMKNHATKVILAHNHPSDDVQPSQDDLLTTRYLQSIFSTMSISMLDHIIVGTVQAFSMHLGCLLTEEL